MICIVERWYKLGYSKKGNYELQTYRYDSSR